jgi:purine-binding chemotaxis protein CheW
MFDDIPAVKQNRDLEFISLITGGQSFCIEIDRIREIRRWEPITMLPHSPTFVLGVVNLRGSVVPIIDLATKLGFEKLSPTKRNVIVISRYCGQLIGLLVDSVSEIITVGIDEIQETPRLNEGASESPIKGVVSISHDMTRVIDLEVLMSRNGAVQLGG